MRKKIIAAILTAMAMLSMSGIPAYASGSSVVTDSTISVEVKATVTSSYAVVLPSSVQVLTDDDNDGVYEAEVKYDAYGKINSNRALIVCSGDHVDLSKYNKTYLTDSDTVSKGLIENSFTMQGQNSGKSYTGSVGQDKVRFVSTGGEETAFDQPISRTESDTPPYKVYAKIQLNEADSYTGSLQFSYGLAEK